MDVAEDHVIGKLLNEPYKDFGATKATPFPSASSRTAKTMSAYI